MARGDNITIPSNTGSVRKAVNPTVNSILILNPNNGIVYVGINGAASPVIWDWIVPSQSRAYLPGPWLEYGLFYVDQSGGGGSGNITVYETDRRLDVPDYAAIGIARLAQQTNLDITEGAKPGNPGVGIARLWADISDFLHILNSAGTDATIIDTLSALGGILTGTLPNPGMAGGAALTNLKAVAPIDFRPIDTRARDIYADRGDATGVVYFAAGVDKYLYFNGAGYVFGPAGPLTVTNITTQNGLSGELQGNLPNPTIVNGVITPAKLNGLSWFYGGLGGDVSLGASVNTWTSVFTQSLAAGTWILFGEIEFQPGGNGLFAMRINGALTGVLNGSELTCNGTTFLTLNTVWIGTIGAATLNIEVLQPVANSWVKSGGATSGLSATSRFGGFRLG